jgi:hypothetical protein
MADEQQGLQLPGARGIKRRVVPKSENDSFGNHNLVRSSKAQFKKVWKRKNLISRMMSCSLEEVHIDMGPLVFAPEQHSLLRYHRS